MKTICDGDAVEIRDGSEAHGEKGTVWRVQENGLIIVELESNCLWPVDACQCVAIERKEEVAP